MTFGSLRHTEIEMKGIVTTFIAIPFCSVLVTLMCNMQGVRIAIMDGNTEGLGLG
jgi:hypothetical protein